MQLSLHSPDTYHGVVCLLKHRDNLTFNCPPVCTHGMELIWMKLNMVDPY